MGVVIRRWVWLEGMGDVVRRYIYRFLHITCISSFFAAASLLFVLFVLKTFLYIVWHIIYSVSPFR